MKDKFEIANELEGAARNAKKLQDAARLIRQSEIPETSDLGRVNTGNTTPSSSISGQPERPNPPGT